ncbi:uncharacterized protein TNCV_4302481 [Trichonephila clavipes]|nr:uncharacterized protein TNCV_4302481 [Trichonephila clavipes]
MRRTAPQLACDHCCCFWVKNFHANSLQTSYTDWPLSPASSLTCHFVCIEREGPVIVEPKTCVVFFSAMNPDSPDEVILVESSSGQKVEFAFTPPFPTQQKPTDLILVGSGILLGYRSPLNVFDASTDNLQWIHNEVSETFFSNPLGILCPRSSRSEEIGGIPLCSLWPTLRCRRVAGVSPLLSIGWWHLSSVSLKRHCCRVSAADKECRVYPLDPHPDDVALYSGVLKVSAVPGFCQMTGTLFPFLDSVVVGDTPGRNYVRVLMDPMQLCPGGEPKAIKRLRSGDLLIETISVLQTKSFILAKTFLNSPVTITPHKSLNSCRGIISEPDLLNIPDSEILEGFSNQGVIQVRRITIKIDSTVFPTKHLILTFNNPKLPSTIKSGYLNYKIRPYIPNPLRCFKCQRFGHSQTSCRGQLTCPRSASAGHASKDCILEPKCINCLQPHPSDSKIYPKWKIEK